MRSDSNAAAAQPRQLLLRVFAGLFGGFLGLVLLKFGNPPIMEKWVTTPTNGAVNSQQRHVSLSANLRLCSDSRHTSW